MTATTLSQPVDLERLEGMVAQLSFRNRLHLFLELGVPAEDILGIDDCRLHHGGRRLGPDSPMSFDGTTMWCKGCWLWWRL